MRNSLLILGAILSTSAIAQLPLSQDDVVSEALRASPQITSARQRVGEAQARVAELVALRGFQLAFAGTLSGSYGRVAEPPSLQSFGTLEGSLIAPLTNRGRANAQIEQGRRLLASAEAQLKRAELDVEFRASQAFTEVWRSREGQIIAEQNLAQAVRQQEDTQKRIDAGDVPAADLLKTQVPAAQNRAALARAKIAVSIASQNLNDLLQRELNNPTQLSAATTPPKFTGTAEQAIAFALHNSPDIAEAEANVTAAHANLRFVRHVRDTDFALQLTHARTTDPTAYSHLTTLALTINLPLIDSGAAKQQVRQAESQLAQAETALRITTRQLRLQVEQAVLDLQGNEANVEATMATEDIARQSLEKARQAYAAGLTTTRDVLDAQLVYAQARIEANAALHDLAIARARLKQLLGGNLP